MIPELITSVAALLTSFGAFFASVISARRAGAAHTASSVAAAEVTANHGSSLKDSVSRIEAMLSHVAEVQRSQGHQIGEIRRDGSQTHELLSDRIKEQGRRIDRLEKD